VRPYSVEIAYDDASHNPGAIPFIFQGTPIVRNVMSVDFDAMR
jgi:hypothetical protein